MGTLDKTLSGAASGAAIGSAVPGIGTAFGAGAGAIAGLFSGLLAYEDEKEATDHAQQIQQKALELYGSLDDSAIQRAAAQVLPPTLLAGVTTSPEYTDAMKQSVSSLKNISDRGGLSLQDRSVQENALARSAQEERGTRGAIMDRFARQGQGGSYAELVAQLQAQQSGANRDASIGLDAAGRAQQRALDALRMRGQLGSQFQQQEYNQKSDAARAQDAINQFNLNHQDQMSVAQWNAQMQKANARVGVMNGQAGLAQQAGQAQADRVAGIGGQLARTATKLGQAGDAIYDQHNPAGGKTSAPAGSGSPAPSSAPPPGTNYTDTGGDTIVYTKPGEDD